LKNPRYESFAHRHHGYAARSDYAAQLDRMLEHVPREQLHVIYSEDFFRQPEQEFVQLTEFLGAASAYGLAYEQHNARPSGSMPAEARSILRDRLGRTFSELEGLTGRRPPWGS